ncbi:GFA family protein [Lysobacter psychrotolerans]|uniref:GFA family protein n=2 Tax=Montanilutibacter psychrotolerans TaxID=1327343 RepID=A0A3M8T4A2_9GAMM|nr:GFA family protein [Lysobacter psychrotolerans]
MSEQGRDGGCQCGAVRYRISGEPLMSAICHCTMCRRASAAPVVAWAMFEQSQVAFDGTPKIYASSEDAQRGFCGTCGTQISFTAGFIPGLIDITVGSLDQPEAIAPQFHYWHDEHLTWAKFDDTLPRHPGFPPME